MTEQWYYVSRGEQVGPVPAEAVRQAVAAGRVSGADVVWREGMPEWVPLAAVPELWPAGGMPLGYGVANYGVPGGVAYAGFWLRVVAAIIDGLVIGVPLSMLVSAVRSGAGARGGGGPGVQLLEMVVWWAYAALMESSSHQATLGKMALGLRVTDDEGRPISFWRATGRHFGKYVNYFTLMVGFMMAGWTRRKQGLHDLMASTLVVRKERG
jgi:uncharacterized RDD family membrane protein YckC